MRCLLAFYICFMGFQTNAQTIDTLFLKRLLHSRPDLFKGILEHGQQNEVQILYTRIDRDKRNQPHFTSYSYRLNPQWYFYPASTVKLAASVFALEKINSLGIAGLTKHTPLRIDSAFAGQTAVTRDTTAAAGLPSIAHYIKKILLVSDNDAFNRLFEFIGRQEINERLQANGLEHSRILNRLAIGDAGETARHTNPITFYWDKQTVYRQEAQYDTRDYPLPLTNLLRGVGYINNENQLVKAPFDFSNKNTYSIQDQQELLKKLLFPEAYDKARQFNLSADDYAFLYRYMSMYPTESDYPNYPAKEYHPAYSKFLFYGSDKHAAINPDIRIFNKFGDSYGYVIDNAYIVDFKNKVEFLLTAVVQANEDGIYNDNHYEYETVCYPFMKNLGQVIYNLELKRKKKHQPDLSRFMLNYR